MLGMFLIINYILTKFTRYLGILRSNVKDPKLKQILLYEMVAR
jgi:hypothetical protein